MYISVHKISIYVIYSFLFAVEDQNFALFNFVNELNAEIEIVQDQIHQVNTQLHVYTCMYRSDARYKARVIYTFARGDKHTETITCLYLVKWL